MASRLSLLVALLGALISQNVIFADVDVVIVDNDDDLVMPYDTSMYRQMMNGAPYYSYCDLPWMTMYDSTYYDKFTQIAQQYNIRPSDVYQHHTIIDQVMPNLPYAQENYILQASAAEMRRELERRGIYYLPTPPSCYVAGSNVNMPNVPSMPYVAPVVVPTIAKRSPDVDVVITDSNPTPAPATYSYGSANAYSNANAYGSANAYGAANSAYGAANSAYGAANAYGSANAYGAGAANAYGYGTGSAYGAANAYGSGMIPSSYDYSLAYRNMYSMLDQIMPYVPRSTYENLRNTIYNNVPAEYRHLSDDLAGHLTTNMRYSTGMAQQRMPSYSFFYYY